MTQEMEGTGGIRKRCAVNVQTEVFSTVVVSAPFEYRFFQTGTGYLVDLDSTESIGTTSFTLGSVGPFPNTVTIAVPFTGYYNVSYSVNFDVTAPLAPGSGTLLVYVYDDITLSGIAATYHQSSSIFVNGGNAYSMNMATTRTLFLRAGQTFVVGVALESGNTYAAFKSTFSLAELSIYSPRETT